MELDNVAIISGAVLTFCQVWKIAFKWFQPFVPIAALVLGGLAYLSVDPTPQGFLMGMFVGGSAVGVYEGQDKVRALLTK